MPGAEFGLSLNNIKVFVNLQFKLKNATKM